MPGREHLFRALPLRWLSPSASPQSPPGLEKKELSHFSMAWLRKLKFHPVFVVTRSPISMVTQIPGTGPGPLQRIPQSLFGRGKTFLLAVASQSQERRAILLPKPLPYPPPGMICVFEVGLCSTDLCVCACACVWRVGAGEVNTI